MSAISGPVAPYSNVPINAEFYQPSVFVISNISLGLTTIVTTSVAHNYVIGQTIRILIPFDYGTYQLNNMTGYVISIPSSTQVGVNINSTYYNSFIQTPYTANISGITNAVNAVITANNSFKLGYNLFISGVSGMTQINGLTVKILSLTSSTITTSLDTSSFSAYTSGGIATALNHQPNQPQIIATGDVNSGATNTSGNSSEITFIPGSFINISPL